MMHFTTLFVNEQIKRTMITNYQKFYPHAVNNRDKVRDRVIFLFAGVMTFNLQAYTQRIII